MQEQIDQANQKLNNLIHQKEKVEDVLLKYQSGKINSHALFENYHNLPTYLNELNTYVNDFQGEFDKSRTMGGSKDALYFQGKRLIVQILAQLTQVQELSNRIKIELNNAKVNLVPSQDKSWETFHDNFQDDPLVDISTEKSKLQLHDQKELESEQVNRDVEKIETDIGKINEMFTSIAGFVHEQGDLVDRIEANVEVSYSQVDSGNDQLAKGVNHKRSAQKKKIFCFIIIFVILIVIGLVLWLSLRN